MWTMLGQHCIGMLSSQCCPNIWDKNAQKMKLCNVDPDQSTHIFVGKPVVISNMFSSLFFNRVATKSLYNLGCFCPMLSQEFIYSLWENNELGPHWLGRVMWIFLLHLAMYIAKKNFCSDQISAIELLLIQLPRQKLKNIICLGSALTILLPK